MGHTALMLSALATSAVPGFQAVAAQALPDSEKDVAVVHDINQTPWLVELPRSADAEKKHTENLGAIRALSEGLRSRVSFQIPQLAGTLTVGGFTLSVSSYLPGRSPSPAKVNAALAGSLGRALAEIHQLPTSTLADYDRPENSILDSLRECASIVDRSAASGLLPQALLRRWETACEDSGLWQCEPTVIHGLMQLRHMLVDGDEVVAIGQWREFRLGDPAQDLAWLTTPGSATFAQGVLTAYQNARAQADRYLIHRSRFYAELDVAKWLLHGLEADNATIISDATAMLSNLHDRVASDLDQALTAPISLAKHPLES